MFVCSAEPVYSTVVYLFIIIIFLHGLGRLTCSGIDALPSFPGASTISSSSRFVVEGVFRKSGVVHSFKMVDPVLFVFGSHVCNYVFIYEIFCLFTTIMRRRIYIVFLFELCVCSDIGGSGRGLFAAIRGV